MTITKNSDGTVTIVATDAVARQIYVAAAFAQIHLSQGSADNHILKAMADAIKNEIEEPLYQALIRL